MSAQAAQLLVAAVTTDRTSGPRSESVASLCRSGLHNVTRPAPSPTRSSSLAFHDNARPAVGTAGSRYPLKAGSRAAMPTSPSNISGLCSCDRARNPRSNARSKRGSPSARPIKPRALARRAASSARALARSCPTPSTAATTQQRRDARSHAAEPHLPATLHAPCRPEILVGDGRQSRLGLLSSPRRDLVVSAADRKDFGGASALIPFQGIPLEPMTETQIVSLSLQGPR